MCLSLGGGAVAIKTLVIVMLSVAASTAQRGSVNLTGGLPRGEYSTGFRVLYKFDTSRTWVDRPKHEITSTKDQGRPVRIEIWYPAARAGGTAMRYGDYVSIKAPKDFAEAEKVLEKRERLIASLSAPENRLTDLLGTPVTARLNATAAAGSFPLLIHFPGLNDAQAINEFVMAEYLASHGYVVAVVSLLGTSATDTDQHRTPADIESNVRDAEFAWGVLRDNAMIDPKKLAVSGESLGGVEAMVFADRNPIVSAAIGLEGTYGFAGAADVLTKFFSYSPQNMTAAVLDLRKNPSQQQTVLDLSAVKEMHFSDRTLITVDQMHHSDFTSFAVVGYRFDEPNTYTPAAGEHAWNRETGYHGYINMCALVLDHLDAHLKGSKTAENTLLADLSRAKDGTVEHLAAAEMPPSPQEFVAIGESSGFDVAAASVARYMKNLPPDWVVNESTFNSLGYNLLGEKRTTAAITAFRLNTVAHPNSANVWDSLADGYIAANDTTNAITAYEHAISAAANDKSFDVSGRRAFVSDEKSKIEKLKR